MKQSDKEWNCPEVRVVMKDSEVMMAVIEGDGEA